MYLIVVFALYMMVKSTKANNYIPSLILGVRTIRGFGRDIFIYISTNHTRFIRLSVQHCNNDSILIKETQCITVIVLRIFLLYLIFI